METDIWFEVPLGNNNILHFFTEFLISCYHSSQFMLSSVWLLIVQENVFRVCQIKVPLLQRLCPVRTKFFWQECTLLVKLVQVTFFVNCFCVTKNIILRCEISRSNYFGLKLNKKFVLAYFVFRCDLSIWVLYYHLRKEKIKGSKRLKNTSL